MSDQLKPGMSYNDLKKAKILSGPESWGRKEAPGKVLADLPSDKIQNKAPKSSGEDYSMSSKAPEKSQGDAPRPGQVSDEIHNHPAFAFRFKDGSHLVGKNLGREGKSPSPTDVHHWLADRGVYAERVHPNEVSDKESISQVSHKSHDPHIMKETSIGLPSTDHHARIDKHPRSPDFKEDNYVPQKHNNKNMNYAFTPFQSIKTTRYGTPDGNLWVAHAKHESGKVSMAVSHDRNEARHRAVNGTQPGKSEKAPYVPDVGHAGSEKQGHLVVGSNNHLRTKMPFFAMQSHDHHIFVPSDGSNSAAVVSMSRTDPNAEPIHSHSTGKDRGEAITNAIHHAAMQVSQTHMENEPKEVPKGNEMQGKKNTWMTHAIYRAPKMTLKDALQGNEPQKVAKSLKAGMSYNDLAKMEEDV